MEKEAGVRPVVEDVAPGQIPETPQSQEPSRTNTFVDNRQDAPRTVLLPPQQADHGREEMVEQEDVPFPMEQTTKPPAESTSVPVTTPVSTAAEATKPVSSPTKQKSPEPTPSPKKSSNTKQTEKGKKETTKVQQRTVEFEGREFENLDPKEYGIDFDEEPEHYYPPGVNENLPDIYRLMASLEEGENQLDNAREPPSLYTRPEQANYYKKISEKKTEIEEGSDVEDYLNNFLEGVRDDVLMIGQISLEEVQEEELRLRDEHISYLEQQKRIEQLIKQKIMILEEEAKKRIAYYLKEKRTMMKKMEQLGQQRERLMLDRLNKAFRRSENQLISVLERRKSEIKKYYGDLTEAEGHYGGSKGRRWKVDWDKTPQPIQIKLGCLRGVKDKLPHGRYVLMVSLYNRLGGHVLRWSNLRGQFWGGATLPVGHDGHFYNIEMKVDQSVFTVLPSKSGVRPGMVLVFELFLLRGAVVPTDRVVGWGCFPVADSTFDIVEGKFKAPFLRGEVDPLIDKHDKVEGLMASELDHWLCNCYFEIIKLPRYLAGQKEYEVELQFSSGMLAFPDRIHTNEEYKDGEAPIPGSLEDMANRNSSSQITSSRAMFNSTNFLESSLEENTSDASSLPRKLPFDITDAEKKRLAKEEEAFPDIRQRRPYSAVGSKKVHMEQKMKKIDSDGSDYSDEEVYLLKKDEDFYPVRGQPGLWYKRYEHDPVDHYHKKLYSLLPKTPVLTERRKRRKLTHLEELEQHHFSVRKLLSNKGSVPREGMEKMQYVGRQLLAELGLSQWRSREFWGMMFMFILTFFLRIYIHYIFQWLLLQALELPVTKFNFLPYTVELLYQSTLLLTREEISVVLLGPFGNILVFVLLVFTSWLMQKVFGGFPDMGSKFIISVGIQAFLDPFLILGVDAILQTYQDRGSDYPYMDAAKLYYSFQRDEGNGLLGILITVFLYFFTCFASGSVLYMYFLRLHNNGRMLDIYWRLHGNEEVFFMPYDLEVSNQELAYISRKCEQWRGEEGERRKVAVYDYIWEEEELDDDIWDENASVEGGKDNQKKKPDKMKSEITTHVSVHIIHLDGLRELYRHFLRLPDGGICEVFGDMSMAGMDKDVKSALKEGAKNMENIMGDSQAHVDEDDDFGSIDEDFIPKQAKV